MKTLAKIMVLIVIVSTFISCGTTHTAQSASTGAFIGGLVDGWDGVAAGALIGGGVGLMADAAEDMEIQRIQKERELELLEESNNSKVLEIEDIPANNILEGSSWRVISYVDEKNDTPGFASMVLSFPTDSKATTMILWEDGSSETFGESYTLVSDALIFTGKNYVTNTKYSLNGSQLVLVSPTVRVVLEEV